MKTVTELAEYTPAHDAIMNTYMEVVHGVYFSDDWNKNAFPSKCLTALPRSLSIN